MKFNANVYLMADETYLLEEAGRVLDSMNTSHELGSAEEFVPSMALPLSRVWHGSPEWANRTVGPEEWMPCLQACAEVLGKHGAVVVEFRSPDHPDNDPEYVVTTPDGPVSFSGRAALDAFLKTPGCEDLSLVLAELMKGSSMYDRKMEAKAMLEKTGGFLIEGDRLVKYYGDRPEATIPSGVRVIGREAFSDMKLLREYYEGEPLDYDAPEVVDLTIPEGVETIETFALAYCKNLESVILPSTITKIGAHAFEGCFNLKEIDLPKGLKEIEPYTFHMCIVLESVTIPEGVEKIGEGAFDGCLSLKKVVIPKSVKEIAPNAFKECVRLRQIILPEHLMPLADQMFPDSPKAKKCCRTGMKACG